MRVFDVQLLLFCSVMSIQWCEPHFTVSSRREYCLYLVGERRADDPRVCVSSFVTDDNAILEATTAPSDCTKQEAPPEDKRPTILTYCYHFSYSFRCTSIDLVLILGARRSSYSLGSVVLGDDILLPRVYSLGGRTKASRSASPNNPRQNSKPVDLVAPHCRGFLAANARNICVGAMRPRHQESCSICDR